MKDEPREVELKFKLDAVRGPEILAWLGQGRRPSNHPLTSIYFDTADRDLHRAGLVLRVRSDGERWIQTVKSRAAANGKLGRGEWETQVSCPAPDLSAARRTPAKSVLRAQAALAPLFAVKVQRQAVIIRTPDSVIEACLDTGTVEAEDRSSPMDEVELELKAGHPDALFALARRLQETFALDLSVVTKADHGFALLAARPLAPRRFQPPVLTSKMTTGESFQAMARAALDQILWNAEVIRAAPTIEAIHQMRVGARRLRATLSTFKTVVADAELEGVKARLRWLSGEFDPARNLDVFIEGPWRRAAPGEAPALEAARAAAYDRARAAVLNDSMRSLALDTLTWIETGPWTASAATGSRLRDRSVKRFAARALEKGRRKVAEAGADLGRLSPEARHRTRILAKRLRYAADVFDQLFDEHPKRAKRFLDALEALLETLGELNDIASAKVMAPAFPEASHLMVQEAARERSLLKAAGKAYKAFEAAKPYWPVET